MSFKNWVDINPRKIPIIKKNQYFTSEWTKIFSLLFSKFWLQESPKYIPIAIRENKKNKIEKPKNKRFTKINGSPYPITNKKSYKIIDVAKMFKHRVKFLPARKGERYASALTKMNLSKKVFKIYGKTMLKYYINNIVRNKID